MRERDSPLLADSLAAHVSVLLCLIITALYLLMHPYSGLIHDSRLYTLQALNHLRPDLYGSDLFLKFGSQDAFTLFTPVYAAAMKWWGAETAASLLTLASAVLLLVSAWILARRMVPPAFAWLGVAVLALVPTYYGPSEIFAIVESFITPRMLSEALCLLALAALITSRLALAVLLVLVAGVIHPIMALPAALLIIVHAWAIPYWRSLWPFVAAGCLLCAVALTGVVPLDRWQLDEAWRHTAEGPHVMLAQWLPNDWAKICTVVATLIIGALTLSQIPARILRAMLVVLAMTLVLAAAGGDVLKLALFVQGQAWRSLWLATTLALLLIPWIVHVCWNNSAWERAAVLLVIGAWFIGPRYLALFFSVPAVTCVLLRRATVSPLLDRLALRGAAIALSVLLICMVAVTWLDAGSRGALRRPGDDSLLLLVRFICEDMVIPAAAVFALWLAVLRTGKALAILAVAIPVGAASTTLAVATLPEWRTQHYGSAPYQAFSQWRRVIPPRSDVLWGTRLIAGSDPMALWLLLERPSYFSSVQANSGLFSRATALEVVRRRNTIPLWVQTEDPIDIRVTAEPGASLSCSNLPVRYIVTDQFVSGSKVFTAPNGAGAVFDRLLLHVCN